MSVAPVPTAINENIQTVMPKNMVLDPGWFDSVSGIVHTRVEVHRMDLEISRLVE